MTTLTKKMAEDLTDYLLENGIRVRYLHSEIDTLERIAILRDLRMGAFDVLVGINLLREGLDLPEVSMVGILDADKEGYLRSGTSLIQTIGRAARNVEGKVIMYADVMTESMARAHRRNEAPAREASRLQPRARHRAASRSARKCATSSRWSAPATRRRPRSFKGEKLPREVAMEMANDIERKMREAAANLEFEKAAALRDELIRVAQAGRRQRRALFPGKAPKIFDRALQENSSAADSRRGVRLSQRIRRWTCQKSSASSSSSSSSRRFASDCTRCGSGAFVARFCESITT